MKYSIGYQLPDADDSIYEIVRDYRDRVSSVYFSLAGRASARSRVEGEYLDDMLEELRAINDMGVTSTLLYNANCYGGKAISPSFKDEILHDVGLCMDKLDLTEITTTSPFVAKTVHAQFPSLHVTASVNMWIGTPQAMALLGGDFDGYYLQREYNRDFERIRRVRAWCDEHGKRLKMLANSGCLYTCPFHTFHDNMVAHEEEISKGGNAFSEYPSPCWDVMNGLRAKEAAALFLRGSWVRPEDIRRYEGLFDEVKLATRMHSNPRRVVMAYSYGRFRGNMFDLTEPSFSRRFKAHILDAERFPQDWFERTSACGRNCESCGFCLKTAEAMLADKAELEEMYMSSSN